MVLFLFLLKNIDAVNSYLTNASFYKPPYSYFNSSGRAYPDISANGNNYLYIVHGFVRNTGGTSASAPTIAALFATLNAYMIDSGKGPLGFINPLLYQMHHELPETFQDIVIGDNSCTEDGCFNSCYGFNATIGWDPVSGLGTPSFTSMLNYLKSNYLI